MEFLIARDEFLKVLSRVHSVAERRNTMPILAYTLIEATSDGITLSATDQEVYITTNCPAQVELPGSLALSAKKLHDLVKELPDAVVKLRQESADRVILSSGRSRFTLIGLPANQFPTMPEAAGAVAITLDSGALKEMLDKTSFAMSQDETRYNLGGIFFQLLPATEEQPHPLARMVTTDTHRLALAETRLDQPITEELGVIIPRKAALELRNLQDRDDIPLSVVFGGRYLKVERDNLILITKLVDGKFPDYTTVIPTGHQYRLECDRQQFQLLVKRMCLVSTERSQGMRMEIADNLMQVSSTNPEQEEGEDKMEVRFTGPSMDIGFNARYLLEIVTAAGGEELALQLQDEESSVLITTPQRNDFLYVVMPMRV